ncbi:hypothetical protein GZL_02596 [Streptomyces sp. 769]|nr:hypothetical protein GZL_02596 [Streptomyces sp. 769]
MCFMVAVRSAGGTATAGRATAGTDSREPRGDGASRRPYGIQQSVE